jgi:methyl-accepting chemotaxis protein
MINIESAAGEMSGNSSQVRSCAEAIAGLSDHLRKLTERFKV